MNTDRCAHHAVFGRPERHVAGQSSDPADQRDPVFAAEEYARLYPDRAGLSSGSGSAGGDGGSASAGCGAPGNASDISPAMQCSVHAARSSAALSD